jgi:ankyrin repeat protein
VLLCWPDLNVVNQLGEAAIHLAAQAKETTYLKILLNQTSMQPNQFGPCGNTPLMMTVNNENVEAIKFCLRAGVNPFLKNSKDQTAFDLVDDVKDPAKKIEIEAHFTQALKQWHERCTPEEIENLSSKFVHNEQPSTLLR